jgi:DNA-binding winged helix-turn-helix (wHTH) protein
MLCNPNRPLAREFLLDQVFGKHRTPLDRSIDVCVSRLRQHLKDAARRAALIRTVRNEGYMLAAEVDPRSVSDAPCRTSNALPFSTKLRRRSRAGAVNR